MALKTWTGGDADWTQASYWGGTLPNASDDVMIPTGDVGVTTDVGTVKTLTLSAPLIDQQRLTIFGGKLAVSGTFLNSAEVQVGRLNAPGTLSAGTVDNRASLDVGTTYDAGPASGNPTRVTTNRLLNSTGFISIRGSSQYDTPSTLSSIEVSGPAGDGTVGRLDGSYDLEGDALLQFASGQITNIQGSISLTGPQARIAVKSAPSSSSALATLRTIGRTGPTYADQGGSLQLRQGAAVTTNGPLEVVHSLSIDDGRYEAGGSQFTVNGAVTVRGSINVGSGEQVTYDDRFSASSLTVDADGSVGGGFIGDGGRGHITVDGAVVNRGIFGVGNRGDASVGSYTEVAARTVFGFDRVDATGTSTFAVRGAVNLSGGRGDIAGGIYSYSPSAGQSAVLMTFAPGQLTGQFDSLSFSIGAFRDYQLYFGSGTAVDLSGPGLKAGLVYNDTAGTITLKVVATPTTTIDNLASRGSFGAATGWSGGTPDFYTDAVVASGGVASVGQDTTVNSLALKAGGKVTSAAGTDLHIGATLAVASGATLTVAGAAVVSSAITCDGSVTLARNARMDLRGNIGGSGTLTVATGATLILRADDTNTVSFAGSGATLELDRAYGFKGTLANLVTGDVIEFAGLKVASASDDGHTLTVRKADTSTATFTLSNKETGTVFAVQDDFAGGSKLVVQSAPPRFSGALPTGVALTTASAGATTGQPFAFANGHDLFVSKPVGMLT